MRIFFLSVLLLASLLATPATLSAQQSLSPPVSTVQASGNLPAAAASTPVQGGRITQTLGPWDLTPPDSAVIITGGGASFGWLNVVNAPLSFDAAMTSSPIESGGFANSSAGDVYEVTFTSGVANGPGDDLVLLDAQFDVGNYAVSSDYDGFVASLAVNTATGIVVAVPTLYYELNAGPWNPDVVGVPIDLSNLGVPGGATVNSVRMATTDAACDPISLAKIGGSFTLTVSPLVTGSIGTASVSGATPFGTVGIAFSLFGSGPSLVNTRVCGIMQVDLTPPIRVLPFLAADASGGTSISSTVPVSTFGMTLYFQALDFSSCTLSNAVATVVL